MRSGNHTRVDPLSSELRLYGVPEVEIGRLQNSRRGHQERRRSASWIRRPFMRSYERWNSQSLSSVSWLHRIETYLKACEPYIISEIRRNDDVFRKAWLLHAFNHRVAFKPMAALEVDKIQPRKFRITEFQKKVAPHIIFGRKIEGLAMWDEGNNGL